MTSTAADRPLPFVTLLVLFVGYACSYFHRADLPTLAPLWLTSGDHQALAAALPDIAALGMFVYGLGKFAGGLLARRFGGRRLFVLALTAASIAEFAAAGCLTPGSFAACRVFGMACLALAWPSLGHVVSSVTPRRRLATVMALFAQSYLLGDAAVRALLAHVVAGGGTGPDVLRTSGTGLAIAAAGLAIVLLASHRRERTRTAIAPLAATVAAAAGSRPRTRRTPLLWLAAMNAALAMARESISFWAPLLLVEWCALGADEAVRATALLPLASSVGALGAGLFADRSHRATTLVMVPPIVIAAGLLATLAFAHGSAPLVLLLFAGTCATTAMPQSLASGVLPLRAGHGSGAARLGFVDGMGTLGSVFATGGLARLRAHGDSATALLAVAGVLLLAAIAAVGFVRCVRSPEPGAG